jgi:hypothetical protein
MKNYQRRQRNRQSPRVLVRLNRVASVIVNPDHRINVSGVVRADEKLTAFLELERVTRESLRFPGAE